MADFMEMLRQRVAENNPNMLTREEMDKRDKEEAEKQASEAKKRAVEASCRALDKITPERYKDASVDEFTRGPIMPSIMEGNTVLFLGTNGIGKTRLGWAVAKELTRRGRSVKFVKAIKLLDDIKGSIGNGRVFDYIDDKYGKGLDCLIIDEIDKTFTTNAEYVYLNYLLDVRYEWMRQTVIMGNCKKEEFIEKMGSAIYSRISGDGAHFYYVEGNDKRVKK